MQCTIIDSEGETKIAFSVSRWPPGKVEHDTYPKELEYRLASGKHYLENESLLDMIA